MASYLASERTLCALTLRALVLSSITQVFAQNDIDVSPSNGQTFQVFAGQPFMQSISATSRSGLSVSGKVNAAVGLPRNGVVNCDVGSVGGSCPGPFTFRFTPTADQAGQKYSVCIAWNTLPANNLASKSGCIYLDVLAPHPKVMQPSTDWYFGGRIYPNSGPTTYSFRANVGCLMSIPIIVGDANPNSTYSVTLRPLVQSSFPPSPSGLPVAVRDSDGAAVLQYVTNDVSAPSQTFEFKWRPARGQESSKLYSVCFEAVDSMNIAAQTKASGSLSNRSVCFRIKVQKCQYCVQPGESFGTIAKQYGTDWLNIYTANPTVPDPDDLTPYTRINTGVFYQVRKGDNAELIARRFFTSVESLKAVNPDVFLEEGDLIEGDDICVLPPVCNVECSGLNCVPLLQ